MRYACKHVLDMSRMIQIRHVPDALHRQLKIRAAEADMTLSDYLKAELEQLAAQPTLAQIAARLRDLAPVELDEPLVDVLQHARNGR
jgi:antitoxin FitA